MAVDVAWQDRQAKMVQEGLLAKVVMDTLSERYRIVSGNAASLRLRASKTRPDASQYTRDDGNGELSSALTKDFRGSASATSFLFVVATLAASTLLRLILGSPSAFSGACLLVPEELAPAAIGPK